MSEWYPYSHTITVKGTNTTREDVLMPEDREDHEYQINNVGFEDQTNGVTSARLFVTGRAEDQFFRQWTTLTADVLYYENRLELRLGPGERVGIAFYGITANDILKLHIRGLRRKTG